MGRRDEFLGIVSCRAIYFSQQVMQWSWSVRIQKVSVLNCGVFYWADETRNSIFGSSRKHTPGLPVCASAQRTSKVSLWPAYGQPSPAFTVCDLDTCGTATLSVSSLRLAFTRWDHHTSPHQPNCIRPPQSTALLLPFSWNITTLHPPPHALLQRLISCLCLFFSFASLLHSLPLVVSLSILHPQCRQIFLSSPNRHPSPHSFRLLPNTPSH
jgi:hypothetical protein